MSVQRPSESEQESHERFSVDCITEITSAKVNSRHGFCGCLLLEPGGSVCDISKRSPCSCTLTRLVLLQLVKICQGFLLDIVDHINNVVRLLCGVLQCVAVCCSELQREITNENGSKVLFV